MNRSALTNAAAWLVSLCVVYVLSVGPAFLMLDKGILSGRAFTVIYQPLAIVDRVPGVRDILADYIELWDPNAFK